MTNTYIYHSKKNKDVFVAININVNAANKKLDNYCKETSKAVPHDYILIRVIDNNVDSVTSFKTNYK